MHSTVESFKVMKTILKLLIKYATSATVEFTYRSTLVKTNIGLKDTRQELTESSDT